jgi:uncharacterized protein
MLEFLGRSVELTVVRFGSPGAFLARSGEAADARDVVLLPNREVPEGCAEGDSLSVFLYCDSDDRPIATTTPPALELGEVCFLEVSQLTPIGAFFRWGLLKDLLVPFAEQTRDLHVGDRHPIALLRDKSERLIGTMKVSEHLQDPPEVGVNDWLAGECWRWDPDVGLFVILEKRGLGLLPASEPHRLVRGQSASFRIAHVYPDGKVLLSQRDLAHNEMDRDAETILTRLREGHPVSQAASPDAIRRLFGLSKKAFKRAVGQLFRERRVDIDDNDNIFLVAE